MEVYMDDERTFYAIIASDMLKDAWKHYNASVKSVRVVLSHHGFTEEEIQKLIEDSRN